MSEIIVHTGQHFDANMSDVFFRDLNIPTPDYNLEISGGLHGEMTGRMLIAIEGVLLQEKPDWVLLYGDTNSTLASALAAAKLHFPIAHVEAGLRSFNRRMPEEVNRILTDKLSALLFCPTEAAVANLSAEGVSDKVLNVGDVMYDVALFSRERASHSSKILRQLKLQPGAFFLATCHRAENTNDPAKLEQILLAFADLAADLPVVLPLHPRTRQLIDRYGFGAYLSKLTTTEPLPYLDMVALEQAAKAIMTDSGGVQKEAFFFDVPCVTMRDETEWVETVDLGWNVVVGADRTMIVNAVRSAGIPTSKGNLPYGQGNAAQLIAQALVRREFRIRLEQQPN